MIREAQDLPRREFDRHPGGRPQVADRGRRSRCFSAPGSQRAPAALARRATAADIMCLVVPAGTELRHVELFGGSTAGAPTLASWPDWFAQKASGRSLRFAPRTPARSLGTLDWVLEHLEHRGGLV